MLKGTKWCLRGAAAALALCAGAWVLPVAHAAENDALEFDMELGGTKIEGSERYQGAVSVQIDLGRNDENRSLWINDAGVWKLVQPKEGDARTYSLSFTRDGEYELTFRVEDGTNMDTYTDSVRFTIDARLADALSRLDALPDPEEAGDSEISALKPEITALQNLVNGLREDAREEIGDAGLETLSALRQRLSRLEPDGDFDPPAAPTINVSGTTEEISGWDYSAGPLELTVRGASGEEIHLYDWSANDGWTPMESSGGVSSLTLSDPGRYRLDFCAQDAAGNRSESVSFDFVVDPDIPGMIEEVDRLYKNAQSMSQNDYLTSLEDTYLRYLDLSPLRQSLIPTQTANRIEYMYDSILEALKFQTEQTLEDGKFIKAVGMYNALEIPALYLGSSDVTFHAERADSPSPLPSGMAGEALAEYSFSFSCEDMEEDNLLPGEAQPVRICIQVPDDLKGKKNVDMLYLGDGEPVRMHAKVRSTEDNLVLSFDLQHPGRYVFACDLEG